MQLTLIVTALVALAAHAPEAVVAFKHDSIQARHHNIGRGLSAVTHPKPRSNAKRCKKKKVVVSSTVGKSSSTAKATSTKSVKGAKATPSANQNNANSPGKSSGGSKNHAKGTIRVSSNCGDIGATTEPGNASGPNGAERWLNCGLDDGGWRPPNVGINDIIVMDLDQALSTSTYAPCRQYSGFFKKAGQMHGIPPLFLAAIAMQESTCSARVSMGGLMQITSDKWGGAPGGDPRDPWFNIERGASYLAGVLSGDANGNIIRAIGEYNGWFVGMTKGYVYKQPTCQQNMDYLQQFFNGWLQGRNGYDVGTIRNKNGCAS